MTLPVILIGAGDHAKVLLSTLKALNREVLGLTDSQKLSGANPQSGFSVLGSDDQILNYAPEVIDLINGIGSIVSMQKRSDIYLKFKRSGYSFATVVHPSALIMDDVRLGEGVQIMAGAVIQSGCLIGANSIINTGAVVDHDCRIGEHVHVAPGAVLSGGVRIDSRTHIGTGAVVIQGIKIGRDAIIGAGAVVVRDIPDGVQALGVPAKTIRKRG
ncbi:MAG: acetyltransferase [Desulfobacteraceae bacterium]|nr:MAG: acetyltransferase [Desulfobacteraceae bacterium]